MLEPGTNLPIPQNIEKEAINRRISLYVAMQRTNLFLPLTRFIGREQEAKRVRQMLTTTRLLTLTGPGGCGKTRLALSVAATLLEQFDDGVWFVDIAPLSHPELVVKEIFSALLIPERSGFSDVTTLLDSLKYRELLLILDNCEHLIVPCAYVVETLLQHCPQLHICITSREALNIPGETLFFVPSLSFPDFQDNLTLEDAIRYESI